MNTCPVYRRSGGHSYGVTVAGPIGSMLTPGLDLERYASLPFACRLCGSCTDVCPVKIDLDAQLFRWRQRVVEAGHVTAAKSVAMKSSVRLFDHPRLFRVAGALARRGLRILPATARATGGATVGARARAARTAGAELSRVVSRESTPRRAMSAEPVERTGRDPRRRSRRAPAGGGSAGAAVACRAQGERPLACGFVHRRRDGGRRDGGARERATDVVRIIAGATDGAASVLSFAAGVTSTISSHGDAHVLDALDALVCESSLGVAENGAVWIATSDTVLRGALFLAARVVIVVREAELVDDLHQAYERIDVRSHSFGAFIAGPSKTADIEQALVIGAHGPKELTLVLVRADDPANP